MKKALRSCVALLLACSILLGLPDMVTAVRAVELTSGDEANGKTDDNTIKYVSFGDSMTNGYGLEGYVLPNGQAVNGFLQESPVAYPKMFADYLASLPENEGKEVDLIQLAVSGMRAEDLTFTLTYDWNQAWETTYNEENKYDGHDGKVHRYRKMTEEEFYGVYAPKGYDYQTYHHFIDGKSSDLCSGDWFKNYQNAYFCAECRQTYYGSININQVCTHFTQYITGKGMQGGWSNGKDSGRAQKYAANTSETPQEQRVSYTWDEITMPQDRGPIYFYHDQTTSLSPNMNSNIWFGNAMAAYAGQFQTAVEDADVISLGVGNANFGVYLLSRMISAMGVLPGFGAGDYCWDAEKEEYNPKLIQNFDYYNTLKPIVLAEKDPLMLAMMDLAEDVVKKNMGTFAASMGVTHPDNIAAMENIMLYSAISYMRSYGMMLDRIAELNPDVTVIIVGLMNACSDMTMYMEDGSVVDMEATFEDLFGLINTYLAALATMKNANVQLDSTQAESKQVVDHSGVTYLYAEEPTVQVLADVFYTEDEGIYSKDNVIRDRFISSVCGLVFQMMKSESLNLVSVTRSQVEAYEDFAESWKQGITVDRPKADKVGDGVKEEELTDDEMLSCAVYLGFEKAIVDAGHTGNIYMKAIQETSGSFDAVFAPIVGAVSDTLPPLVAESIGKKVTDDVTAWAMANQEILPNYNGSAEAAFVVEKELLALNALSPDNIAAALTNYGMTNYQGIYTCLHISDVLYDAMMPTTEDDYVFETLLNMFARNVIGDGLGQHPSKGGHVELYEAIVKTWQNQSTAAEHTQIKLDEAVDGYVADIYAEMAELLNNALYTAATTGTYSPDNDSYYLALSDFKLTGYEKDLAERLFGAKAGDSHNVIVSDLLRADDLLWLLDDTATPDAYFTNVVVPAMLGATECEDLPALRAYVKDEVQKADLITVSVGPSSMAFASQAATVGMPTNEQWVAALGAEYAGYAQKLFDTAEGLAGENAALLEGLAYCNTTNKVTYPALLDMIRAINGDAQVVLLGYYDSMLQADSTMDAMGLDLPVGKIYSALNVEGDNIALQYAIEHNENTTYVEVRNDSGHGDVTQLIQDALDIQHQHSWSEEWKQSETHHWHTCMTPGCDAEDITKVEGSGYEEHDYTANAYICGDCGYAQGVAPIIDESDLPDAVVYTVGQAGSLTVAAKLPDNAPGGDLTYQWYISTTGSTEDSVKIEGATEAAYKPDSTEEGEYYYYCVVTNTYTYKDDTIDVSLYGTAVSKVVKVTLIPVKNAETPVITAQPTGGSYLDTDTDIAALTVAASVSDGGTLSYQWCRGTTNSNEGGTPIANATSATYKPTSIIGNEGTYYYYCVVTNTNAAGDITGETIRCVASSVATIIVENAVNASKPFIARDPQNATYVQGKTAAELTVVATIQDSGTLSYQWYKNGEAIENADKASYLPVITEVGAFEYYCVVTNTNNAVNGEKVVSTQSATATIIVEEPVDAKAPEIKKQPEAPQGIYQTGVTAAKLSVDAKSVDGGVLSYQWYLDGTAISGATSSSYTPATNAEGTFTYRCEITNTNENATGSNKVTTVSSETVTVYVKNLSGDAASILSGVLSLTDVTNSNAGSSLSSTLSALESEYAAHIADASSVTYYKNDKNVYLALGGTTAAASGGYVDLTDQSLYTKSGELAVDFTVDNNAEDGIDALDMATYIASNKAAIQNADFITYQVEAASFAEYMLDTESGTPSWSSEYSEEERLVSGYLSDLEDALENQMKSSLDSTIASIATTKVTDIVLPMVERLMYAATVYFHETAENLATIRSYNPDATIVVVGMNNPVYGMNKLNISGKVMGLVNVDVDLDFDFSGIFAQVIRASNMNSMLAVLEDTTGNSAYITLPTGKMIAGTLPTTIDVSDALNNGLKGFKAGVEEAVVVSSAGQQQIANAIVSAVSVDKHDDPVIPDNPDDPVDPLAGFEAAYKAASLTLEGDITINYKAVINVPAGTTVDYTVGALFWTEQPSEYTVDADPILQIEKGGVNGDLYRFEETTDYDFHVFSYKDVAAKELNDDIYTVVYVKSGEQYIYSKPLAYGVAKTAKLVLSGNYESEYKRLVVDLLNYGSAAQTYFGYRTNTLANADLTNAQKQLGTQEDVSITSSLASYGEASDFVAIKAASLFLESILSMNMKAEVKTMDGYTVSNVKLIYDDSFTDVSDWEASRGSKDSIVMTMGDTYYEGAIPNIVAKGMRDSYYAQVAVTYTNGSGAAVTEYSKIMKVSVADLAYLVRSGGAEEEMKPLTESLMKYGDAAIAYFDSLN